MTKAPTKKVSLTPEQFARLVEMRMQDDARRSNRDARQAQPVSDEDLRSFPSAAHLIR